MSDHDDLCPIARGVGPTGCHCDLIAKVRADERQRMAREHWVAPTQYAADIDQARDYARGDERERIAAAIEAMERVTTHTAGDHALYTVWQDDAARIARSGGTDD